MKSGQRSDRSWRMTQRRTAAVLDSAPVCVCVSVCVCGYACFQIVSHSL